MFKLMKAFKWWQLQDENISLQIKCKSLEDNVADNALGATVMSVVADIDVDVVSNVLETCCRFGKLEKTTKLTRPIARFTNRKYRRKLWLTKKN